jgi:hypothetical protein
MPPWHIDPTVGVQQFKNDMSLSQDQIDTIVRWVDQGAPLGNEKDMPAPRQWANSDEWKAAKELGQPDIVVKSTPWTMPARHQDVWWRPTDDIGITEPRWVRAVEMRPGTLAGRKITHHAVAYLVQEDPDSIIAGSTDDLRGRAMLMEWAIGKGYDQYHPDTGKLLLPGSKISFDIHYHAVGEDIRDDVEWESGSIRKVRNRSIEPTSPGFRRSKGRIASGSSTSLRTPSRSANRSRC